MSPFVWKNENKEPKCICACVTDFQEYIQKAGNEIAFEKKEEISWVVGKDTFEIYFLCFPDFEMSESYLHKQTSETVKIYYYNFWIECTLSATISF